MYDISTSEKTTIRGNNILQHSMHHELNYTFISLKIVRRKRLNLITLQITLQFLVSGKERTFHFSSNEKVEYKQNNISMSLHSTTWM